MDTNWTLSNYRLRRIGSRAFGHVTVLRAGSNIVVSNANGDLTDQPMFTLPDPWRNNSGFDCQLKAGRLGISMWHVVAMNATGEVRLVGGINGTTLTVGDPLRVVIDYLID